MFTLPNEIQVWHKDTVIHRMDDGRVIHADGIHAVGERATSPSTEN